MKFNKIKQNKLKFKPFLKNQHNLFTFNLKYNKKFKDIKNSVSFSNNNLAFNKIKLDDNILKVQFIKSKIIKLTTKNNLLKLKYLDITTKNYKQGIFTTYLNSPIITSLTI